MSTMDEIVGKASRQSQIEVGSEVYREIFSGLTGLNLNLAFFAFSSSAKSHAARMVKDGHPMPCAALTLYLRYEEDCRQNGVDAQMGNWNDAWVMTGEIRNVLNTAYRRYEITKEFASDHTFVFVDTLERIAFLQIGRQCKAAVSDLVSARAPGVEVSRVFWTSGRQFHVMMKDKTDYKRVKRAVATEVTKALPKILKDADVDGCCQSYDTQIEFGYLGMNDFHLVREDI